MSDWEGVYLKTLAGDALAISSYPDLLQSFLNLRGYVFLGECKQLSEDAMLFSFGGSVLEQLAASVKSTMVAPVGSHPGLSGEGAIQWMYLEPSHRNQRRIAAIYRYHTAGGQPGSNCSGEENPLVVPYTALYWFYSKDKKRLP